jgi:hypothetical protein
MPQHCLDHLLNRKYDNDEWLNVGPTHNFPSHMDKEISKGRKIALSKTYLNKATLDKVKSFVEFCFASRRFEED